MNILPTLQNWLYHCERMAAGVSDEGCAECVSEAGLGSGGSGNVAPVRLRDPRVLRHGSEHRRVQHR